MLLRIVKFLHKCTAHVPFSFFLYFRIRLYVYIATMGGQLRWACCPFWQPSIRLYYMYIVLCFIVWLINFLSLSLCCHKKLSLTKSLTTISVLPGVEQLPSLITGRFTGFCKLIGFIFWLICSLIFYLVPSVD